MQVRREGDYLVGVSDPFRRRKASWIFVSVFCFLVSVTILMCRSKCTGETPEGQDFEAFIGAEKADEIKELFSTWIHTIYRELSSTIW